MNAPAPAATPDPPSSSPRRAPLSLSFRLFVLAAAWTAIALATALYVLIAYYRASVERGFNSLLDLHLFNVVAAIQQDENGLPVGAPQLGDPRFAAFQSGWYWQVIRLGEGRDELLVSPSLSGARLLLPRIEDVPFGSDFQRVMDIDGPAGRRLRAIEQLVVFGDTGDRLSFTVTGDLGEVEYEIAAFRNLVLAVFGLLGLGLAAATLLQVRIGLKPLRDVRAALGAIREGRAVRLEGDYPAEIAPLTREINALIESNAKIIERARTQVGNLAHALKTPLAVITNEARAARTPLGAKVTEQAGLMRHQIDYYLDRARVAATAGVAVSVTEVAPVAETFARAMRRIYADRGTTLDVDVPAGLRFQGERQDLEELMGNLVDNAFKWARSRVVLTCRALPASGSDGRPMLAVTVEDDGPGLTDAQCAEAVRRGRRLDETQPGSGLGLSIVCDLADLYGGDFALARSGLGGLKATLRLPAA